MHILGMQIGLRHFSAASIDWLTGAVGEDGRTRHALARELCERENWRNARGVPCVAQASKALHQLTDKLGLSLPEARPMPAMPDPVESNYPDLALTCGLADLGAVTLEPVGDADRALWRAMMASHHPEGWSRMPGVQLRYWVRSSVHGRLGGIGFAAASWHQKARDDFIGWSAHARAANLGHVVNNDRFLLLPGVRVDNLASHALALATARLGDDWEAAHGVRPLAAYSYVGPERPGTCYRAAGWKCCAARTSGRPPGRRAVAPKAVWVKPLAAGWRAALCRVPDRRLGATPTPHLMEDADWADIEYRRGAHPDGRLRERVVEMGRAWEHAPGASLPVIFPGAAEQKAAYRLLSNDRITMEHVLEPHQEATVDRCRLEPVVLAIQDTTTLNYNGHRKTGGLVNLGGGGSGSWGLLAHVGLAVTEARRPLGVYELNATQRDATLTDDPVDSVPESVRWLRGLERAGQLASACPDTRVITVCDREGDIWDMFRSARETGDGLLVRSDCGRQRRVAANGGTSELWDYMAAQPSLGTKTITIRPCGGPRKRRERKARLELRAARVDLAPPTNRTGDAAPLAMLAVSVFEPDPPNGKAPLHWVLLTTEGEADIDNARRIVAWYEARWTIEEYFRILKVGTRVEDRKLDHADDLRKCLAFDAVTAWRVMDLERRARDTPERPALEWFSEHEINVLYIWLRHRRIIRAPPERPPDIRTFVIDLARLAGFRPSKRQPLPGTEKIWQAWRSYKEGLNAINAWENDKAKHRVNNG